MTISTYTITRNSTERARSRARIGGTGVDSPAPNTAGQSRAGQPRDPMVRLAAALMYMGIVSIPWLALRIGSGITISDCLFVSAFCCCGAAAALRQIRVPSNRPWRIAGFLTMAGATLSLSRADSVSGTLAVELRILFLLLAWQFAARALLNTEAKLARGVDYFIIGATISGIVSAGQALGGGLAYGNLFQGRAVGLTGHPNDAGGSLCIALIMAIATTTFRGSGRWGWRVAAVFFIAGGLILSASVTGMLAAIAGTLLLVLRRDLPLRKLLLTIAATILALAIGTSVQSRISESTSANVNPLARFAQTTGAGTIEQNTLESRLASDRKAWSDVIDSPLFGRGLDDSSAVVIGTSLATHNIILGAWRGGGLLFAMGIALALVSAVRPSARKSGPAPLFEVIYLAAATALLFSMTAPSLSARYFWLPFVLLLAHQNFANPADAVPPTPITSSPPLKGHHSDYLV